MLRTTTPAPSKVLFQAQRMWRDCDPGGKVSPSLRSLIDSIFPDFLECNHFSRQQAKRAVMESTKTPSP